MQIKTPILDNDQEYLNWVKTIAEYSCPESKVTLHKGLEGYHVHIDPCSLDFRDKIIKNILEIHHRFNLKIKYSKSLKISKKVSYFLAYSR